jgi:hypothetical protein
LTDRIIVFQALIESLNQFLIKHESLRAALLSFSPRETALILWVLALTALLLSSPKTNSAAVSVIKAFFVRRLVVCQVGLLLYFGVILYVLKFFGLWKASDFSLLFFWFASTLFLMFFRVSEAAEERYYYANSLRDSIKLTFLLEFLVNVHSFSLWVELILFPVIALLALLQTFSENDIQHKAVHRLLSIVISLYVLIALFVSIRQLIAEIDDLNVLDQMRVIVLPIVLTFFVTPYLYFLTTFSAYELAFSRLSISLKPELLWFAKISAFLAFRQNRILLNRWSRLAIRLSVSSRQEVIKSLQLMKSINKREHSQTSVSLSEGWGPNNATRFLVSVGIETGHYEPSYGDTINDSHWSTSSAIKKIDESFPLPNNLAYYIEGTQTCVKQLKLKLNVNEPSRESEATTIFLEACQVLFRQAMESELEQRYMDKVLAGIDFTYSNQHASVDYKKENWPHASRGGHSRIFVIRNKSYNPAL